MIGRSHSTTVSLGCPGGVHAAVPDAGLMPYEDLSGAEGVPVGYLAWTGERQTLSGRQFYA
jgi:hypothetical protein